MRHYSMWPLLPVAACGAEDVIQVGELGLVDCQACRDVVARAEVLGRSSAA